MSSKNHADEIRIRNIPKKIKSDLINISDHTGETMSALLRPVVKEFIDSFPDHYKEPMEDD